MFKFLAIFLVPVIFFTLNEQQLHLFYDTTFTYHEPFKIIAYQKRETIERGIIFLEDSIQQKFVLKAYADDRKEEAICEHIGSFIGTSMGISVNKSKIITSGSLLTEIDNGISLATLHTYVPGRELCKWFEMAPNDIILKGGLISKRHLDCLSLSTDLCDIIALDIFLNNQDRHHENCFFDERNMRYYAIDMGDIFLSVRKISDKNDEMTSELYQELETLVVQDKIIALDSYYFLNTINRAALSPLDKKGLERVCFILKSLIALYPVEHFLTMWLTAAKEIGCVYTEYKKNYLRLLLQRNMQGVNTVIEKINELLCD